MAVYLLRIIPRHWTVFGNLTSINDDTWMAKYATILRGYMIRTQTGDAQDISNMPDERLFYRNIPKGKKLPLFGICRNNVSESAAHSAGISGVRYSCPPNAIKIWLEYAHNNVSHFKQGVVAIDPREVPYTSIGMKCYNDAVLTNTYNVVSSETINDGTFTVLVSRSDTPNSRIYTCELKGTESGICDCVNFQMYNMVCMHLVKAYRYLKHIGYLNKVDSVTWVKQIFPKCMVMEHVNSNIRRLDFTSYVFKPLNETVFFCE